MKLSWTAATVFFVALLASAGCNDYGNTFQANTGATVTFLSPSNVNAGGPDVTVKVNGGGFVAQTVVQWNGGNLKTTVTTDTNGNVTSVTALVPAALTAKSGLATVQTLNPHSGTGNNGLSNPITFVINNPSSPVPTISAVSPATAVAGSPDLSITVTGTNFLPTSDPSGGSLVRWNANASQTNLALGSISSTQIQATVPAALLAAPGSALVTVNNPPAPPVPGCLSNCGSGGGGTSFPGITFTITAAGANAPANTAAMVSEETPAVSLDGRYVAYTASLNGHSQIFARDTCQGAATGCQSHAVPVSVDSSGSPAAEDSHSPSMSSDGRYVAFSSAAANLVANAPPGRQVYLRDTCLGADSSCTPSTQLISTDSNGALEGTESILPSVSASGRFVAFLAVTHSRAANSGAARDDSRLKSSASVPNSGYRQVFVRDTCLGVANCTPRTARISLQPGDAPASGASPPGPAISGNASHVAISGGNLATLFTRSVAVDDRVILTILKKKN